MGAHTANTGSFKKGMVPWNKKEKHPLVTPCACECGLTLTDIDERGRQRKFIRGHNPMSEDTRKKLREYRHLHPTRYWLGKKMSKMTRRKMSLTALRNPEKRRESAFKSLLSQHTRIGPNSIEKKLYDELKRRGFLFETQKLVNGKFLVDAYIPSLNLVIEADGDYWHSLDRVEKKDRAENAYLKECGFGILRLSETEIRDGEFTNKLDRLEGHI